jgi:hypothetical protein
MTIQPRVQSFQLVLEVGDSFIENKRRLSCFVRSQLTIYDPPSEGLAMAGLCIELKRHFNLPR